MGSEIVKIRSVSHLTHDVIRIETDKPQGYEFKSGQATDISINKIGWSNEKRPFSFTNLPEDDFLEFTIKTYPSHQGVTNELLHLKTGDELILHAVFGAITYKGEGVFIAGGAGVTPFIAIFRKLRAENKIGQNLLVFANKKKEDIILENEFKTLLGDAFVNILSDEQAEGYHYGLINEDFLKSVISDFKRPFYVCGPPPMMDAVLAQLSHLGVDKNAVIIEI